MEANLSCDSPSTAKPWVRALRPFSYPASLLPFLVATAVAAPLSQWNWAVVAAEFFGVLLLHSMGNLFNDYFDFKYGVDTETEDNNQRPGRFLVKGIMIPREVLFETAVCAFLLALIAIFLLWKIGWSVLIFGALGVGGGYAYTGPPFTFKYKALGEATIFMVFGPLLMIGAAYTQTLSFNLNVLLISIPAGLSVTSILAAGSLRDYNEEGKTEITTLSKLLGRRGTLYMYLSLLALPHILVISFIIAGTAPVWSLLSLVAVLPTISLVKIGVKGDIPQDFDALTAQRALTPLLAMLFISYLI